MNVFAGRLLACVFGLAIFASIAPPVSATTTTWQFTATVRDFYGGGSLGPFPASFVAAGIDAGTPVTGHLVMDDSQPDADPADPTTGRYDGSVVSGAFQLGDVSLSLNQPGGLTAALDRHALGSPPEGTSLYRIFSALDGIDSTNASLLPSAMAIDLVDSGQDVITTEAFPIAPPDLSVLDPYAQGGAFITSIQLAFPGTGLLYAEITGLTIPEPGTATLLGLGLGLMGWRSRRRAR